jgi:probable O-glycosylation ligase (exosortase A-associated)
VKQLVFVTALTAVGAIGAFVVEPFVGVAVYYLFAVLRPQAIWEWALPPTVPWSQIIAWSTIASTVWFLLTGGAQRAGGDRPRLTAAHKMFFLFGAWICLSYQASLERNVAWPWLLEYLKLFVMFGIASLVVRTIRQVWWIYLASTVALTYIAYEMNFLYLVSGRLDIANTGYGGFDNNGAGLMLAMGVPLAIHGWEAATTRWRWVLMAGVPVLVHAVLMSYSRGAMLSLLVASPLLILRSRRRGQAILAFLLLLGAVPFLAGQEIRARFLSIEGYESDGSANARFMSWAAAIRIANDYPLFGVGIRNSELIVLEYGADAEGRAIHSQYLQTLADSGYPGLFFYLVAIACTLVTMSRTRRTLKMRDGPESRLAHSMLNGTEGALVTFLVGGSFLSLEVFELPYLLVLIGAQVAALSRLPTTEVSHARAAAPLPVAHQRA